MPQVMHSHLGLVTVSLLSLQRTEQFVSKTIPFLYSAAVTARFYFIAGGVPLVAFLQRSWYPNSLVCWNINPPPKSLKAHFPVVLPFESRISTRIQCICGINFACWNRSSTEIVFYFNLNPKTNSRSSKKKIKIKRRTGRPTKPICRRNYVIFRWYAWGSSQRAQDWKDRVETSWPIHPQPRAVY